MPLTPVFMEVQTGDQMGPALEEEHGGVTKDVRLTEYVNFVGRRLLPFSPRADFKHTFKVLESPKIVNAFALGNGNVYVTRGTLNLLDDEAELSEIVGHEIGHVAHRHIASRLDQAIGFGLLLATAEAIYTHKKGGELNERQKDLVDKASSVVPGLVMNGFGREQELESDASGLDYMVKAGYDPMGGPRVFQKFQKLAPDVKGLAIYFQSHPNASQRVDLLARDIRSKYPGVVGESYRDRYQAIVKGGSPLADTMGPRILGMKPAVAAGAAAGLALLVTAVVLSV